MVPLVVKAMNANESYRRSITSAYDHVLVDEYQDVNPGQVGLIDHFVNDGVRLWAVGDDDRTLYAFRASDVRYILEFTKKFPAADIHALDRNYRSCSDIVSAAKRLIRHNRLRFDKDYPTREPSRQLPDAARLLWPNRAEPLRLRPDTSDIDLFGYGKRVVNLDAEVPHGTFDSSVPK
jgi:superfamily I DNA/RNA helicase